VADTRRMNGSLKTTLAQGADTFNTDAGHAGGTCGSRRSLRRHRGHAAQDREFIGAGAQDAGKRRTPPDFDAGDALGAARAAGEEEGIHVLGHQLLRKLRGGFDLS
jgi:hypothetical protein